MAKTYEKNPPFTRHDVPFMLRDEPRTIHYTLYIGDDGESRSNIWFNCKYGECIASEANDFECADDCQPELNQVEDLAVMAAVTADANK